MGVYRSTPEGKFLYVNDAMARIFECENAEEMLRLPVEIRYNTPGDRAAFLNVLRELGKVPYFETEVPTKTGKLKTLVISAVLEDGFITGMVTDITERKHLEAQLRHAQKMEAVGTLAGGIAHDFNNILNVIIGYGAMVQDKLEDDSLSKGLMNEVLAAAERAVVLTKRLLAFSRKQVVEVRPINVNETILGIQKMLVRTIGEDIDFHLDLKEGNLVVMADAGQLEQVLMNLVSNARDSMPEGGHLTIGTGVVELDDEYVAAYGYGSPGTYALITVADTGHGMDKEIQKKIFEPFFTTKAIGEGTGLGLAISYGIIKQHGGYIKAYSEPGQGTEFKIYLPLIDGSASPSSEKVATLTVKGGNETVLLAEDDASLRKLSRIVLESFGYSVITAEDGEDAIGKFMENRDRIDLVILDMIMPKKNGKEVSEALRKVSPGIKILFVSGYTMDIIKSRELTESGFDFIHKPVRAQDLLRKVREILDK
jgi:signal transduction histidine kinase/ActR/RegA family two-component response regulator